MFIAHIPAAYLLSRRLVVSKICKVPDKQIGRLLIVALFASVLPDFDLFYFYWFDNSQNHHHTYWPHIPFYWLLLAAITTAACVSIKALKFLQPYFLIFYINILLHLILDTFVGGVPWFYPFSNELFQLIVVAAKNDWWVANFIWHWTFGLELLLVYWAALTLVRDKNRRSVQARF